ncbi:MAG: DNA-binding protein [Anaerolineae bacterium]|nr:DNA-binding protein [Anaerolineae bacterium]
MEVLLLAQQLTPDWVLMDERLGRRIAKVLKFPLKGTLGILLAAVIADLMTKQEALTSLSKMLEEGIRISPRWQN